MPARSPAVPPEPRSAVRQRWLVFGLCAATMFTEGYDAQFMGSVVPGIAADWGVAAGTLWPTLSAGLVGLMLGAFFIAPLADNYGRRRVIIYSVAAFGVLTIASVLATNDHRDGHFPVPDRSWTWAAPWPIRQR